MAVYAISGIFRIPPCPASADRSSKNPAAGYRISVPMRFVLPLTTDMRFEGDNADVQAAVLGDAVDEGGAAPLCLIRLGLFIVRHPWVAARFAVERSTLT